MHAVDPGQVRANAENISASDIVELLHSLAQGPQLVVISGGNPALHELSELVDRLHADGKAVAVETQGSVWRPWLKAVDRIVVSPKPPSSGMATPDHLTQFRTFCATLDANAAKWDLKVVIFDQMDLDWAERLQTEMPDKPLFLSAGTDVGLDEQTTVSRVRSRYRWLCESVARRPALAGSRVLPQLHVVAWGTARGV
jgi:7-carboxy-7-deazaguanine synthase